MQKSLIDLDIYDWLIDLHIKLCEHGMYPMVYRMYVLNVHIYIYKKYLYALCLISLLLDFF